MFRNQLKTQAMPCFWLKILVTIAWTMSYPVSSNLHDDYNNMQEQFKKTQENNQHQNIMDMTSQLPWCPNSVMKREDFVPNNQKITYTNCISSRNMEGKCVSFNEYLNCVDSFVLSVVGNNNCKCLIDANLTGFCCENPVVHNHTYSVKITELDEADPVCGLEQAVTSRITNGMWAEPFQVPWLAAIFRQSYTSPIVDYVCGGSLISASFVLTAAHCVKLVNSEGFIQHTYKAEDFYIRLGDYNVMSSHDDKVRKVMDLTVVAVLPHPQFNTPYKYDNDIALIRLNETVNYFQMSFIKPVCLIGVNSQGINDLDNYFNVMVAGRGKSKSGGDSHAPQFVKLNLLPLGLCQYFFLQPISEKHLCAGDLSIRGGDSCTGDSGGPVMIKDMKTDRMILVGIVSFGKECGRLYPAVYTNVRHYIEWITEGMRSVINQQGQMPVINYNGQQNGNGGQQQGSQQNTG